MQPHDRLLQVVEAYIDAYSGLMRLREIKALLLIQRASAVGMGVSVSELARRTNTPRENVRRQIQRSVKAGYLRSSADTSDRRATLYSATDTGAVAWQTDQLVESLARIFGDKSIVFAPQVSSAAFDVLIAVIDILIDGYLSNIRIRGAKMALLVMRATLQGTGLCISELARVNDAPLETVRRTLARHVEMGHICFVEAPDDERKILVVSANPNLEVQRVAEMDRRLDGIGWSRLFSATANIR